MRRRGSDDLSGPTRPWDSAPKTRQNERNVRVLERRDRVHLSRSKWRVRCVYQLVFFSVMFGRLAHACARDRIESVWRGRPGARVKLVIIVRASGVSVFDLKQNAISVGRARVRIPDRTS